MSNLTPISFYYVIAFDSGGKGIRYVAEFDEANIGTSDPETAKRFDSKGEADTYIKVNEYAGWVITCASECVFEVNGEEFILPETFSGCYGKYWQRDMFMKHSSIEPEGFDPDSIGEEWQYLETPDELVSFIQNIPNKGGYAPQNWEYNKKYFILNECQQIED